MKKTRLITSGLIVLIILMAVQINAQQKRCDQRGNYYLTYLELDENQKTQAETFYTEMQKTVNTLNLDRKEKELELKKLMIADNVEEQVVFSKVEEISQLQAEIRKARMKNKIQLRSILTANQKVLFDSKEIGRMSGKRNGGRSDKSGRRNRVQ